MQNLAGVKECDNFIPAELEAAGFIAIKEDERVPGEVPTFYRGYLAIGPYVFRAVRCWVYYSVRCNPELPLEIAKAIDGTSVNIHGSRYSGGTGTLGDVVRAEGFAGGMRPRRPVEFWHVDTEEGLKLFVERLKELLAK